MPALFRAALLAVIAAAGPAVPDAPAEKGSIGVHLEVIDGKVVIQKTVKGAPAAKAGVKDGDIVLKVNDVKMKEFADQLELDTFIKEVTRHKAGQMVTLRVKRGDKETSIEIILAKWSEVFPKGTLDD